MEISASDHHLVSNSNNSGSSASLSCELRYHSVVPGPLLIQTGTQSVPSHLSAVQTTTRSSLSMADPHGVMSGQQSMLVQQSFVAGQQSMMPEQHLSMSGQTIRDDGSARASSSFSLKYPTQVASASDTCSSLPVYLLDNSLCPSAAHMTLSEEEEELEQIVIHSYEHKEEFKEGQFDIVLVYSESDRDEALTFMEILMKFVTLLDGNPPSICVLDRNANLNYINSRFKHMEEALQRSTYMFLFLTKDFCGDSWAQLQRDECLMESIHNPDKKWCVVPILTKSRKEADYQLPFGLRALKGVEISHMLRGKTLNSVDVNALRPEDVDRFFLKNLTKMLNDRIYLKIEREKRQLVSFQNWLKEEKHRRWKELQKEKLESELRHMKHVMERQTVQKELEDRKMQEMRAAEAANAADKEAVHCIRQLKITEATRFPERLQPLVLEAGSTGQKVATKAAAAAVEHHHHYYGPVHQSPAEQTIYKIYGPVSNSQIGHENIQNREKEDSNHVVLLDEKNLETDAPESMEYIVVTEEEEEKEEEKQETASTSLQQDACLETEPVGRSGSAAGECDDTFEGMFGQRPTAVVYSDVGGQAFALSSFLKSMHPKKDEMSTEEERSPEVDRPQSLPVLKDAQSILSHCCHAAQVPHLPHRKSCASTCNSSVTQDPMSSVISVIDAGNFLQGLSLPQSFLNDQSVRPMAAVMPICQKLLPEPSDDEQGEEMRLKLPCGDKEEEEEEETDLKSPYLGNSARSVNVETNVAHTCMNFNNGKTLTVTNEKYQEHVAVTGQETSLKLVSNSAQSCSSSIVLKTKLENDIIHRKPEDVVGDEVSDRSDTSGSEEKLKHEGEAEEELTESFAGSSSVDPVCSHSQNILKKQTDVGTSCTNESAFCHRSPDSTSGPTVKANRVAENKSTCAVS